MDSLIKFSEDKKQVSITLTYPVSEISAARPFKPECLFYAKYNLVLKAAEKMREHCKAELHKILSFPDAVITPDLIYSNTASQCFNIRTYEWLEKVLLFHSQINLKNAQDKFMARKVLILYGDRSNIEIFKATLNALSE